MNCECGLGSSSPIAGLYFSGDGAHRDADGHYQITGRVDDVIIVQGHRIGTAEIESAMVCDKGKGYCMLVFLFRILLRARILEWQKLQ